MDKSDKEKIEKYSKEIKTIKRYSSNSNFNKVINTFNLNNYV